MDAEFFDNITENSTFNPNETYTFYFDYYVDIPTAIAAILSTIANALIIFMAIRFQLLCTRLYFYLTNWCICNFVVTASAHVSLNIFGVAETVPSLVLCIWEMVNGLFMFGNLIFVMALILDWYIMTFRGQSYCGVRCRRSYKLIAAVVWFLLAILLVKSVFYCLEFIKFPLVILIASLTYLAVAIMLLIIFILRLIKLKVSSVVVEKSNIELKLALSHFLCWLPNIIFIFIHMAFQVSVIWAYISCMIWYSNACVIFLILYFYDESFRNCFHILFKIKVTVSENPNKDIPLVTVL